MHYARQSYIVILKWLRNWRKYFLL